MTKIPEFPDVEFDAVLNLNDPDFIEEFRKALNLKPGDVLEISTPQFDRTDGITPAEPNELWGHLHKMSAESLKQLGCQAWDEPDKEGKQLLLFPAEWYSKIPEGFQVTDISGELFSFKAGETDEDKRFGCLSYGVEIRVTNPASTT